MKTLDELYSEVVSSEELKKEFCSLRPEQVEGFAEKHGCIATLDEIKAFLTEKASSQGEPGELSDSEIGQAAGGKGVDEDEAIFSLITLGISCVIDAIDSAVNGNCGTAVRGEKMLCET